MREARSSLPLRVVVASAALDVAHALQHGRDGLIAEARRMDEDIVFDFEVSVEGSLADGRPRLLGPYVQGPPLQRFVYIRIGTYAGDAASPWGRRAKVPLTGIDWPLIEALEPGQRLEARYAGRGPKGDPSCASVRLLPPGWRVVPD